MSVSVIRAFYFLRYGPETFQHLAYPVEGNHNQISDIQKWLRSIEVNLLGLNSPLLAAKKKDGVLEIPRPLAAGLFIKSCDYRSKQILSTG